jgi:FixJ family two-component response regulator
VVGVRDISSLLEMGATRFLAKPLDKEELREAIERCMPTSC